MSLVASHSALANLSRNQRRWILLALLVLLHLVLLQGVESAVARTLLVVHIGLFILWQPFVRGERRLSAAQLAAVGTAVAAAALWLNWWLMILWVMVLAGIIGGKVFFFAARGTKILYLLALAYLVTVLLVLIVPQVLPEPVAAPGEFLFLAKYVLPVLFAVMAVLPAERDVEGEPEVVDFIYGAFVVLMLAVLVLGSVAVVLMARVGYIESIVVTIAVLSGVLFVLAWAWDPHAGFGGFSALLSRYLLSVGLPAERWLHDLADHAQREDQPDRFLDKAVAGMARLPGVVGGEWRAGPGAGSFGTLQGQRSEYRHGELSIAVYTQEPLSPALVWHFDLLAQLLAEFHQAKVRGLELQHLSYVKAIHETGARLTHDVKNLLQSLNTLCFAAESEGGEISPQFQALLRRQLPVIAQRLQQTLDKLRRPAAAEAQYVPLAQWWAGLRSRYAPAGVAFAPESIVGALPVPATLFNSVAENLLENALTKRAARPGLQVEVSLEADGPLRLAVSDDGEPVPEAVAAELFRAPVPSEVGLGIGLYQAARHAEFYRYSLELAANRPGQVRFELRQEPGDDLRQL